MALGREISTPPKLQYQASDSKEGRRDKFMPRNLHRRLGVPPSVYTLPASGPNIFVTLLHTVITKGTLMRDLFAVANLPVLHVPMIAVLMNLVPTSGNGKTLRD